MTKLKNKDTIRRLQERQESDKTAFLIEELKAQHENITRVIKNLDRNARNEEEMISAENTYEKDSVIISLINITEEIRKEISNRSFLLKAGEINVVDVKKPLVTVYELIKDDEKGEK